MKQDILEVLREWMVQPNPLMQVFSIRGLGHLLQHPLEVTGFPAGAGGFSSVGVRLPGGMGGGPQMKEKASSASRSGI